MTELSARWWFLKSVIRATSMSQTAKRWSLSFIAVISCGVLFALGENPKLIDHLVNYPNPFDSRKEETFITYQIPQDLPVRVRIYDLFGYQVKDFHFSAGEPGGRAGENQVQWDGTDQRGEKVTKGGYICQVTVEGDQAARGIRKIGVIH